MFECGDALRPPQVVAARAGSRRRRDDGEAEACALIVRGASTMRGRRSTDLDVGQAVVVDQPWQDVTALMLESPRKHLRALIMLNRQGQRKTGNTEFQDEVGETTTIESGHPPLQLSTRRSQEVMGIRNSSAHW